MLPADEIDRFVEPDSKRYGRLLNWQNPGDPFWHYGIGLSDSKIFDTGQGLRAFERKDAKHVISIDDIAFTPDQVIRRLKHALVAFGDWEYNYFGWNCEHLARLVATGTPRCYQSKSIWMLCSMTPDGDHKTANEIFESYLKTADPLLAD